MERKTKNRMLFFAGLTLFAAALVLGSNFLLGRILPTPAPESPLRNTEADAVPNEEGSGYRVQKGTVDRRPIRYTADGFLPQRVIIQETDDLGCLMTVVNQSAAPLRVGVNPHDPAGDPGANYGEIAPGGIGILDVRYAGFEEITLHSHTRPRHELAVTYGPGCE